MRRSNPAGLHLYRDRRRRLKRLRWARRAAAILAALLALILAIRLLARPQSPGPAPGPLATEPAPEVTPEPTSEPTPEPTEGPLSDGVPAPMASVGTQAELIDLYWWMIETGADTVTLDALTVPQGQISDITDKFSNYFDRYRAYFDPAGIKVEFKTGLRALKALQAGDLSALDEDARAVAEGAKAIVDEVIAPGMTDWEKELALHDALVDRCEYTLNPMDPYSGDARGFFKVGQMRCAGYCDLFRLLGRLAGLEVEMIGGPTTRDESGSKGHAWNLVRLDGLWYVVDTVWDDPIEDEPTVEHTFFNVPYACFEGSRTWDADFLPEGPVAETLDGNYFYYRPEYMADNRADAAASAIRQMDEGGRAYLLVPDKALAQAAAVALKQHYGRSGHCYEMSEDVNFNLYRYK